MPSWNKGKALTNEHKLKISKANQNKMPWNKGMKATEDNRIKRASDATHEARRGVPAWNKGKSLSKEHIKKLKNSHKGQHNSPNTKFKTGDIPWNFGISPSDETKQRISKSVIAKNMKGENHPMYGKHHIDESKKKMSKANSGENHPQWQGGISFEPYCSKFNEKFKEFVREQFDRKCFICNKSEAENKQKLSVHHTNYNKNCLCDESECRFIPLCISCHSKTNSNREYWEEYLQSKVLEFSRR